MSVKTLLKTLGMAIALLLILTPLPTLAAGNQSNQDLHQPAMLIAPDPDFKVSIYAKPELNQRRIGYGMGGDRVTVLEQVGSNEGFTWNLIRFDATANLQGWVQDKYVSLQPIEERSQSRSQSSNGNDQNRFRRWGTSWDNQQNSEQSDAQNNQQRQNS